MDGHTYQQNGAWNTMTDQSIPPRDSAFRLQICILLIIAFILAACAQPNERVSEVSPVLVTDNPSPTSPQPAASATTESQPEPSATNLPTPVPATATLPPPATVTPTSPSPATATASPIPPTLTPTQEQPTPVPTLARTLSLQSPRLQGDDVLLLQQRLVELGYTEVGTPDGIFGQMTQSAVVRFQTEAGLTADGVVGPMTWAALWNQTVSTVPTPTSVYAVSQMVHTQYDEIKFIGFGDDHLWLAAPGDRLVKIDPVTGKKVGEYKFGCQVCFGMCELIDATKDGDNFWAVQYGGTKEQDCNADNPWEYIGFTLRKTDPESGPDKMINVSNYFLGVEPPYVTGLAAYGDTIWLGVGTAIIVIDADRSGDEDLTVLKTIYPGIQVNALLNADDTIWAAGESLVAIDPDTYRVTSIYPLTAEALAFDGEKIWGSSWNDQWVRSIDPKTRQLGTPISLSDIEYPPIALAFDGENLWVAFEWMSDLAVIPIK
jgi:hypothetical protein